MGYMNCRFRCWLAFIIACARSRTLRRRSCGRWGRLLPPLFSGALPVYSCSCTCLCPTSQFLSLCNRSGAQVTLFESEAQCGGHTLTDDSSGYPVDLGFQVFNLTTYPHLVGLLEELGVDTEPSEMSFSLSVDGGRLEWGSDGLDRWARGEGSERWVLSG